MPLEISHEEWIVHAKSRYGEDARNWQFICPICKTVQSGGDFEKAGVQRQDIGRLLAFSCIGRHLASAPQKAFGGFGIINGEPCDYTSGGLINISPLAIVMPDGKSIPAFDFASNPLVVVGHVLTA